MTDAGFKWDTRNNLAIKYLHRIATGEEPEKAKVVTDSFVKAINSGNIHDMKYSFGMTTQQLFLCAGP